MLSKQYRLTKNKDFQRVFKEGKYISLPEKFLYVKILKNSFPFSRFGFVVSNKVSNKANKRNKIKRLLREAVKSKLSTVKSGFDIIIVAKKGIEGKSLKYLSLIINLIFERI